MRTGRRGIALLVVLASVLLVGALVTAALVSGSASMRARAADAARIRAFQAADGGLALAVVELRDDDTWATATPVDYVYAGGESVSVAVAVESAVRRRITATSTVDGATRTAEMLVDVAGGVVTRVPGGWGEL